MVLSGQEARMKKAENLLKTAQFLFQNGYYNDCISRAYYAVFHATVALLFLKLNIVKDRWEHVELHKAFLDNFCKRGYLFNNRDGDIFAELLARRVEADYLIKNFKKKDAEELLMKSENFLMKVNGVLKNA